MCDEKIYERLNDLDVFVERTEQRHNHQQERNESMAQMLSAISQRLKAFEDHKPSNWPSLLVLIMAVLFATLLANWISKAVL